MEEHGVILMPQGYRMQAFCLSVCSDFLAERGGEGQSETKSEGAVRVRANVRLSRHDHGVQVGVGPWQGMQA